jgi:hypothetical protein
MADTIPDDAYVMIIGAMKCGTTSLYEYLKVHPAICPAIDKEPEFFSENQGHGVSVLNYADLWPFNAARHQYALEASTGYTKYPAETGVAARIHAYGIQPRFIYLVRNPFDRIESHFDFMRRQDPRWSNTITGTQLLATSNYYLQLQQFRQYFPRERLLVLDFDDLVAEPHAVVARVYNFLRLSDHHFPKRYKVRNPTRRAQGPIARLRGWLAARPRRAQGSTAGELEAHTARVPLTDAQRDHVHAQLAPDMRRLRDEYEVDVAKWGFM